MQAHPEAGVIVGKMMEKARSSRGDVAKSTQGNRNLQKMMAGMTFNQMLPCYRYLKSKGSFPLLFLQQFSVHIQFHIWLVCIYCYIRHRFAPVHIPAAAEYGADANPKYQSAAPERGDYSESYQCIYHEHLLDCIENRPYLWATHVWNMFDFAADGRDEGGARCHSDCRSLPQSNAPLLSVP